MQLNRKTLFEGKPRNSETSRPIKQNVNVSCAEIVNPATKYLRDFTEHIPHTLDGHILDGPPSDMRLMSQKAPPHMLREF